jgi:hypothetical protein
LKVVDHKSQAYDLVLETIKKITCKKARGRGRGKVNFECDFFIKSEQEDVSHVSERYIGKSDPYIVMVSTPNAPGGLFEKIEKESEESCIYITMEDQ